MKTCEHLEEEGCWRCCSLCNYNQHICPGCGKGLKHGQWICDECVKLYELDESKMMRVSKQYMVETYVVVDNE